MGKATTDRKGEINYNKQNCMMKIIEYRNATDIDVEFLDYGYIVKNATYDNFKKGRIKNNFYRFYYGVGYLGGNVITKKDGKSIKSYTCWRNMLKRCYDINYQLSSSRTKAYVGCYVDNEWHNYSKFKDWWDKNYKEIDGIDFQLDKDILFKNNKMYSERTCVFVPREINQIIEKHSKKSNECIGVRLRNNKFEARCNIDGKAIFLGRYNTEEEAFQSYKLAKEKEIRRLANKYKDVIDERVYNSLINWNIDKIN